MPFYKPLRRGRSYPEGLSLPERIDPHPARRGRSYRFSGERPGASRPVRRP